MTILVASSSEPHETTYHHYKLLNKHSPRGEC